MVDLIEISKQLNSMRQTVRLGDTNTWYMVHKTLLKIRASYYNPAKYT